MENSEKAKREIEATLMIIKSVVFLENQTAELIYELDELQDRYENAYSPEEKEDLLQKMESRYSNIPNSTVICMF